MGTPLGPPQPPRIQTSYPHLLAEDTIVWTRWLEKNLHRIREVWYDVHVGAAVPLPTEFHPAMEADLNAITRKRIDVVARTPT